MANRVLGKVTFLDQKREGLTDEVYLVSDVIVGQVLMNGVMVGQKVCRKFFCRIFFFVFLRQENQETESGHEGVETGAMSGAAFRRSVFSFCEKNVKKFESFCQFVIISLAVLHVKVSES